MEHRHDDPDNTEFVVTAVAVAEGWRTSAAASQRFTLDRCREPTIVAPDLSVTSTAGSSSKCIVSIVPARLEETGRVMWKYGAPTTAASRPHLLCIDDQRPQIDLAQTGVTVVEAHSEYQDWLPSGVVRKEHHVVECAVPKFEFGAGGSVIATCSTPGAHMHVYATGHFGVGQHEAGKFAHTFAPSTHVVGALPPTPFVKWPGASREYFVPRVDLNSVSIPNVPGSVTLCAVASFEAMPMAATTDALPRISFDSSTLCIVHKPSAHAELRVVTELLEPPVAKIVILEPHSSSAPLPPHACIDRWVTFGEAEGPSSVLFAIVPLSNRIDGHIPTWTKWNGKDAVKVAPVLDGQSIMLCAFREAPSTPEQQTAGDGSVLATRWIDSCVTMIKFERCQSVRLRDGVGSGVPTAPLLACSTPGVEVTSWKNGQTMVAMADKNRRVLACQRCSWPIWLPECSALLLLLSTRSLSSLPS